MASGCSFFGKEEDHSSQAAPGQLSDGATFIGSWSSSFASVDSNGNPKFAFTTTFTFDPNGVARIEFRDAKLGGLNCTGFGQFRNLNGSDVIIYVQATSSASCAFPAQFALKGLRVTGNYIEYKDANTDDLVRMFADRAQTGAPTGVWNFHGAAGIDYLFLDQRGYFIVQTSIENEQSLLQGYYVVNNGSLVLKYFSGSDPAQVFGQQIFTQFIANDQSLRLLQTTTSGDLVFDGERQ